MKKKKNPLAIPKIKNLNEIRTSNVQYRIFFLFLGITLPIIELFLTFTKVHLLDYKLINYIIGFLLILMYIISFRSKWVLKNMKLFYQKNVEHI